MLLREGGAAARIRGAVAVAAAAGALLLAYAAVQDTQNGHFGLVQGGGWAAYSRAAPFADCRVFTPPKGTESLCDPRDARDRPGPDFYAWDARSPAVKAFKGPPFHSAEVGAFGKAAIKAQPKAYAEAVATDLWRYVDSDAGPDRYANGDTPAQLSLARRRLKAERPNVPAVEALYGDVEIRTTGAVSVLADLQRIVRVHGVLVLLALFLSLAGAVLARGHRAPRPSCCWPGPRSCRSCSRARPRSTTGATWCRCCPR